MDIARSPRLYVALPGRWRYHRASEWRGSDQHRAVKRDTQTRLDQTAERTAVRSSQAEVCPEFMKRIDEEDGLLYA